MAYRSDYNSNIKDHGLQITGTDIIIIMFHLLQQLTHVMQRQKRTPAVGKWHQQTRWIQDCYKPSICKNRESARYNKLKHNKVRYAYKAVRN